MFLPFQGETNDLLSIYSSVSFRVGSLLGLLFCFTSCGVAAGEPALLRFVWVGCWAYSSVSLRVGNNRAP